MADPIPDEDNIRAQTLWKRIDNTRDSLESEIGQMQVHWKDSVDAIAVNFSKLLEENKKFMEQKQIDIQSDMKLSQEEVKKTIDDALAALSRKLDEYMGGVEQRFNNLQVESSKKFDDANTQFVLDSKTLISQAKSELEVIVNNANSSIMGRLNDHKRDIQLRFNGLEEKVESTAKTEVEKYFHDLSAKVGGMEKSILEFTTIISDQITKYQTDTSLRVSAVGSKLDDVLGKLRGILKEL